MSGAAAGEGDPVSGAAVGGDDHTGCGTTVDGDPIGGAAARGGEDLTGGTRAWSTNAGGTPSPTRHTAMQTQAATPMARRVAGATGSDSLAVSTTAGGDNLDCDDHATYNHGFFNALPHLET